MATRCPRCPSHRWGVSGGPRGPPRVRVWAGQPATCTCRPQTREGVSVRAGRGGAGHAAAARGGRWRRALLAVEGSLPGGVQGDIRSVLEGCCRRNGRTPNACGLLAPRGVRAGWTGGQCVKASVWHPGASTGLSLCPPPRHPDETCPSQLTFSASSLLSPRGPLPARVPLTACSASPVTATDPTRLCRGSRTSPPQLSAGLAAAGSAGQSRRLPGAGKAI